MTAFFFLISTTSACHRLLHKPREVGECSSSILTVTVETAQAEPPFLELLIQKKKGGTSISSQFIGFLSRSERGEVRFRLDIGQIFNFLYEVLIYWTCWIDTFKPDRTADFKESQLFF